MKKLLNTLYVTTSTAYLSKDGTNVVVSSERKELFRIPIQNIQNIVTFGYQGASPGVMKLCVDNHVGLSFFSPNGRFISRIQGPVCGNIHLRKDQYSSFLQESEISRHLSALLIAAKIYNSRVTLRRFVRDYPDNKGSDAVAKAAEKLMQYCRLARNTSDIPRLRGIEGEAASLYFSMLPFLILRNEDGFSFSGRRKRPPTDIINAMLSFGYSLLANEYASALEGVGLDPAAGFMHALRPGRNSLALDLMEELRSYFVDRLVLTLINTRQITTKDFIIHHSQDDINPLPVNLTDNVRKTFLAAWQMKKKTEITHPFLGEKMQMGLIPHIQSQLLARYLRHDIDDYPAFLSK